MTTVRLYLDIDGVINAEHPRSAWPHSELGTADVPLDFGQGHWGTARLEWAVDLVAALRGLDVDLVWTTAWTDLAPTVAAPAFGIGVGHRFLTPIDGHVRFPTIAWKEAAVLADQQADPSPFIWVDDELTPEHGLRIGARFDDRGHVVCSEPWVGVTPLQVERMARFIAGWSLTAPSSGGDARPRTEEGVA